MPDETRPDPPSVPDLPEGKPLAVTIFGILSILFGIAGGLSPLVSAVNDAQMNALFADAPLFLTWTRAVMWPGFAVGMLLLALGAGLLLGKGWAWKAVPLYCVLAFVLAAGGLVVNGIVLTGVVQDENFELVPALVGGLIGGLFGLAFPVVFWILMRRRKVNAYFTGG